MVLRRGSAIAQQNIRAGLRFFAFDQITRFFSCPLKCDLGTRDRKAPSVSAPLCSRIYLRKPLERGPHSHADKSLCTLAGSPSRVSCGATCGHRTRPACSAEPRAAIAQALRAQQSRRALSGSTCGKRTNSACPVESPSAQQSHVRPLRKPCVPSRATCGYRTSPACPAKSPSAQPSPREAIAPAPCSPAQFIGLVRSTPVKRRPVVMVQPGAVHRLRAANARLEVSCPHRPARRSSSATCGQRTSRDALSLSSSPA